MKLKNMQKKISLFACSAIAFSCGVLAVQSFTAEADVEFAISGNGFRSEYNVGESVALPQGTFEVDGQSVTADTVVYYPNGACYSTNSVSVGQTGQYVVEYKAKINGELYTERFSFMANDRAYSVTSARSSAIYGADLLMDSFGEEYYTGVNGINLSLADGDVFNYNQLIDLSGKTKMI